MLPSFWRGHWAERAAMRHLRRRGLRILGRNVRVGPDELDLIVRDGQTLVAVEVRYRARGRVAADLSVDRRKHRRIQRAIQRWKQLHHLPRHIPVRIDLMIVGPDGLTWTPGIL